MLQTSNAKYHVVPEGEYLGFYVRVQCGLDRLFEKPMPEKAKVENEEALLEWVDVPFEDHDTTDSE